MLHPVLNAIGWVVILTVAVIMTAIELVIKVISAAISIVCVVVLGFIAPIFRIKALPKWMGKYLEYSLKIQRWDITCAVVGHYRNWLGL